MRLSILLKASASLGSESRGRMSNKAVGEYSVQSRIQQPAASALPLTNLRASALPLTRNLRSSSLPLANRWTFCFTTLASLLLSFAFTYTANAESIQQERTSGPVRIKLTLEPKEPVIGDTVTLKINVVAEKDVEVLMPDFGEALNRFSIVDFAPRETIDDDGRTIASQTYRLDPPASGRNVIPPILIEYVDRREGQKAAPDDLDAYEVLTERIVFQVASVLTDDATAELRPPLGELKPLPTHSSSNWKWFLLVIVLGVIATPFVAKSILAARRRGRRRSAYDVAQARLQKLLNEKRETPEQIESFYIQLSGIIRRYIEDRFEMRAPELTTEEFLASIGESPDFSEDHQRLLREFLRQSDLVKFARAEPTDETTNQTIEKARRFLEETREDAPLIEEPAAHDTSDSESHAEVIHG